jgi:hypothetical protein
MTSIGINPSLPLSYHSAATVPFPPLPHCRCLYAFPISTASNSASVVCHHSSSSLMLSSRSSPSVLTLGRLRRALSRVCFIGSCPLLAPLPLPRADARLTHPWCRSACHSGRCLSSLLMVPLLLSSAVSFCDGCAPDRADHQCLGMWLGRCHMCRFVAHARLAVAPMRALAPVPPRAWDLLRGRCIRYYPSLFFLSPHPQIVYSAILSDVQV